jgi:hypothetical protein
MTLSGTRESEHPSQRIYEMGDTIWSTLSGKVTLTLGDWPLAEFSKNFGSAAFTASDHCSLELKSLARVSSICVELW